MSNEKEPPKNPSLIFFPGITPHDEAQNPAFEKLLRNKEAIITATRKYVREQVNLWRQIPFLALEADFRADAPFQIQTAYSMGHWHFGNGKEAGDKDYDGKTCVDLETGNLLTNMPPQYIGIGKKHFYRELGFQSAPDSEVFRLLEFPEQLSAANIIEELRKVAKNPLTDTLSHEGIAEYKEKQRQHYNITPIYTRQNQP